MFHQEGSSGGSTELSNSGGGHPEEEAYGTLYRLRLT